MEEITFGLFEEPWLETYTQGVENSQEFFIKVIDGKNPFRFKFLIKALVNGGSVFYSQLLSLTTKCPSLLEFHTYYDNVESFRGDIGLFTFPAAVPTLSKCN